LLALLRGLIAPDPANRFPNAESADLLDRGAATFQRELVKGNLSSEYENEIRLWLQEVK
jgi:serine/threonine-protein kinase